MISKNLATFFSIVFGPIIWLPLLLIVFMVKTGLSSNQVKILFPVLFIFQVCIPLLYIAIAYKLGRISDLDLTKKQERIVPIIIALISLIISLVAVKFIGSPILFHLYTLFTILLIVNGIITIFWKISFHMGITVIGSILINFLYQWQFPILYLAIPFIYWSRLTLKKHTKAQLITALLLNTTIILLFIRIAFPEL